MRGTPINGLKGGSKEGGDLDEQGGWSYECGVGVLSEEARIEEKE